MSVSSSRVGSIFSALFAGVLFGAGLIVSGMSDPAKVKGFLDLGGLWDPSLAFVMVGAIGVGLVGQWLATRWRIKGRVAVFGQPYPKPKVPVFDRRLILGSLTFGVGWGLVGICPGPAVVLAGLGNRSGLVFLSATLIGMLVYSQIQRGRQPR